VTRPALIITFPVLYSGRNSGPKRGILFVRYFVYFLFPMLLKEREVFIWSPKSGRQRGCNVWERFHDLGRGVRSRQLQTEINRGHRASGLGPSPTTQGRTWCAFSTTSAPRPPSTSAASGVSAAVHPDRSRPLRRLNGSRLAFKLHCVFPRICICIFC